MRIFGFEPAEYTAAYQEQGWVHIRDGVSAEFHEMLQEYMREQLQSHILDSFAIKGKKEQSLFEFPEGVDYPDELFDVVSELCGLNRATMTLSERHIQAYEANAAPEPPAHKDRFPSQVSVGLSISIPAESRLVLYPYDHREINPFSTSAGLRQSLQPDELPEVILKDAREVVLDDHDRDVVAFPGSTTWHLRRRAARSVNLYLKFNDFGCDPLGEDPRTTEQRAWTLEALKAWPESDLEALIPVLSRRMDTVSRTYTRNAWQETLHAQVFGELSFGITPVQLEALRAADGHRSLASLVETVANGADSARARDEVLRLVEQGALDLRSAEVAPNGAGSGLGQRS